MIIRSPPPSLSFKGQVTKHITVKRSIILNQMFMRVYTDQIPKTHMVARTELLAVPLDVFSRVPSLKFQMNSEISAYYILNLM